MKKFLILMLIIIISSTFLSSCVVKDKNTNNSMGEKNNMKIVSSGIVKGVIEDKYGKRGDLFLKDMPILSIPIEITNPPENVKSYAVILEDLDAIPVAGFSWIHWSVANLKTTSIKEGESGNTKNFIEGTNSWSSGLLGSSLTIEEASRYGGMSPPDKMHTYNIAVYALTDELDLKPGFYLNELYKEMEGKIIDKSVIKGNYKN